MRKEYEYKLQGDGRDSWTCTEYNEDQELISKYMLYEDPYKKPVPDVDIITMLKNLSPETLDEIKKLLTK